MDSDWKIKLKINLTTMKALKNKTAKALQAINDIKESQSTRLFFESLPMETKQDLYKSIDELKRFYDNIPTKK